MIRAREGMQVELDKSVTVTVPEKSAAEWSRGVRGGPRGRKTFWDVAWQWPLIIM